MSRHGNAFHITGPLWGQSTGDQWIALTKNQLCIILMFPFGVCLNKMLNKQSSGWRFETHSLCIWHHCNVAVVRMLSTYITIILIHLSLDVTFYGVALSICQSTHPNQISLNVFSYIKRVNWHFISIDKLCLYVVGLDWMKYFTIPVWFGFRCRI